jgi:hypothetical protein
VVETHPESLIDLRVHAPFPALLAFAESFDYEKMDSMEHGHIPAVIILVKALEAWKSTVRDFLSSTLACSFAYQEQRYSMTARDRSLQLNDRHSLKLSLLVRERPMKKISMKLLRFSEERELGLE